MNYLFSLVVLLCLTSANSQRLRKEIRDLSPSEFEATLTAFRRLYESGAIANFARRHAQADMPAHGGSQFLPWHRHAIYNFENEFLNAAGGQLSGLPYWDSTLDARNPEGSVLLTPEAFGTARGCVTNGAAAGWMKPGNSCLRRNVNGPWLHSSGIAIFSRPGVDFATFATSVEMTVHSYTHNGIGGDMASIPQSAYDPLVCCNYFVVNRSVCRE
ncbi:hypothetical protein BKA69DRAFT_1052591 [Paraphysoderma sedebokerense]|nr:hypothetical protein BKA69DRAFT_1052591 [Paraphysoderma sedebokerense]